MENKEHFKKYLLSCIGVLIVTVFVFVIVNINEYNFYKREINYKLSQLISEIKNKYPKVSDEEILSILKSDNVATQVLSKYGYDIENDSYIENLEKGKNSFLTIQILILCGFGLVIIIIFVRYNLKISGDVKEIVKLVEKINHRKYELELDNYSEDELSILRSEIYKTTIMLKEAAENSLDDKINLKNSLSDISHQLKTPLTSILIMLDAIIEEPDMDEMIRMKFIKNIKREIININFLVQSILKLSKFDANTINFINEKVALKSIIDESCKNVSMLCDLRNITLVVTGKESANIMCDFKWQVEAVTNILKNCVEHSNENSKIYINYEQNKVYSMITIKDEGIGIKKDDLPHIFERFYKGSNSSKDSVGIGLALAKSIIENSNGRVGVESREFEGTTFTIKYFGNSD